MGRYRFGQIVEAWVQDGLGNTALHPVVVIDNDEHCNSGEPILGIFVSSSPTEPCPYYHIQVHNSSIRDRNTGFYYPCWAKCNLPRELETRRIERTWGYLPDSLSNQIAEVYDRLFADDDFDDWQ